jgi:adenine-specific DNA-methyltransferase
MGNELGNMHKRPLLIKSFREYVKGISKEVSKKITPLSICARLLSGRQPIPEFMMSFDIEEKYYWIGNVYTSLIPASKKKELAAHFTPPHIARYVIKRAEEFGVVDKTAFKT